MLSSRVKAQISHCEKCLKWLHAACTLVQKVTISLPDNYLCWSCENYAALTIVRL